MKSKSVSESPPSSELGLTGIGLANIFTSEEDNEVNDNSQLKHEELNGFQFNIKIAEAEWNTEKKTLFATYVWNGARLLCTYIETHRELIKDKSVLELGAGVGLPSLMSWSIGASYVCASDYPSEYLIETLTENMTRNCMKDPSDPSRSFSVVGYKWGADVSPLIDANRGCKYDVVVASECLWRHEQHEDLLLSLSSVLKAGGIAILTFSHHIPGIESGDLLFFTKATSFGFRVTHISSTKQPDMWTDGREVDMFIYVIELAT
mmetsp:Transcript_13569/g.20365  ORF Transcript_13569/g.20365 Transcript_13569/m.20365 type:complete len:263 (+) Transcript_13569:46-834(+)